VRIGRSRSSKVIDVGVVSIESAYATSYSVIVILVLSRTAVEILHCRFSAPHRYSTPILGEFPLDQIAHVGVSPSINLKLIS